LWQVWQNNRETDPVSNQQIKQHFTQSVSWLNDNYTSVENIENPILWWMIKQAALNSDNDTLNKIYLMYKKNHLVGKPANLSTPMFDRFYHPKIPDISLLGNLNDYQLFFFYALSCDANLASEPVIQRQMYPEFCSLHYLHPRCITHQLMGLRFMQRYQCGYDETVTSTIAALQQVVKSELTWDFRVGDAYIQRVLMLVETGAYAETRPVWINNILNAQNHDGSWDDFHPVIYLGNGYYLGHTSMLPAIKKPEADFHTTAQAIWLLSLLLKEAETVAK
jgi:hypothetical protein